VSLDNPGATGLTAGRVLAGDAADQPGRLGGALSAAGAQRAASGDRGVDREGGPQLRSGGEGRQGRAGPVGVVDLAVPGSGDCGGRRLRDGCGGAGLAPAGWGVDAGPGLGAPGHRRRDPVRGRRATAGRRHGRAGDLCVGRAAGAGTRLEARGDSLGGRAGGDRGLRRVRRRRRLRRDGLPARRAKRGRRRGVRHHCHAVEPVLRCDLRRHDVNVLGARWRRRARRSGRTGRRRRDGQPGGAGGAHLGGTPRTTARSCPRW
jgi:hypothetical protein